MNLVDKKPLLPAAVFFCLAFIASEAPFDYSAPVIVIFSFLTLVFSSFKIKKFFVAYTWPLIFIIILGLYGVAVNPLAHYLRDVIYALIPVALIHLGFYFSSHVHWLKFVRLMIVVGLCFSIYHLHFFLVNPELLNSDLVKVRGEAGGVHDLSVLALVIALFHGRVAGHKIFTNRAFRYVVLFFCLLSLVLSYSRTSLLMAIVLSLALWGVGLRVNIKLITAAIFAISCVFFLSMVGSGGGQVTFSDKLKKSITEVAISDYKSKSDINEYWRGYEAYRAALSFASAPFSQKIVGQGFGSLVDLGFYIKLGEREYRYIPVLHNGYMYILVKTGVLGVFLYLFFYLRLLRYSFVCSKSSNAEDLFFVRLLFGIVVCLILTMVVIGGMAEFQNIELIILVGFLLNKILNRSSAREELK